MKYKAHLLVTKILKRQNFEGNEEIDLREKNILSWQNIWNSRQITADIKVELENQEEVSREEELAWYMYFSWSKKCKPCHGGINSQLLSTVSLLLITGYNSLALRHFSW